MNCIIFARIPQTQTEQECLEAIDTCLAPARLYADYHDLHIVDEIVYVAKETSKGVPESKLRELRRSLNQYPDVNVVILATTKMFELDDYAAFKAIIDRKNCDLVVVGAAS